MKSKPIETNNAKQSKRMGRPRAVIDWKIFNGLCEIQCTEKEIATVFHVSPDTIERACQREKGMTFAEYFAQKREDGRVSLRRKQWKLADRNAAMAIFLGKNYLGQAEKSIILNNTELDLPELDLTELDLKVGLRPPDPSRRVCRKRCAERTGRNGEGS